MIGQPRNYPALPPELATQLAAIEPSDSYCRYYPAMVTLRDGTECDRVYFAEAGGWITSWGVWPDEDKGKAEVRLTDVAAIHESPSRLPARFADKLYQAGESGMGYTIFTVQFQDGSSMVVGTGNAVDFVEYPPGQSANTVIDVLPHIGRNDPAMRNEPGYAWCLFGTERS